MREYFQATDYISQSFLKQALGKKYSNPNKIGTYTDSLLTAPEELDTYKVYDEGITPARRQLMEQLFNNNYNLTVTDIDKYYYEFPDQPIYGNGKYSTERILKDLKEYEGYWNLLSQGYVVLIPEEVKAAKHMQEVFNSHPATNYLKNAKTQVPVFNDDFHGFRVKGLLDFQEETSRITDLKTVYSIKAWKKNFWMFRYDIQLAWYYDISYSNLPPRIIFLAPDAKYPVVVELQPTTLMVGRSGADRVVDTFKKNGKTYHRTEYFYGYQDLLFQYGKLIGVYSPDYQSRAEGVIKI